MPTQMTEEEYRTFEREADEKHEFYQGRIVALAGGSRDHNRIASNILRAVGNALDDACFAYGSDMRVYSASQDSYVYPDVSVVCGTERYADEAQTMLENPTVVIEVLSASTEGRDRGRKAGLYRGIESIQAIVLVAQDHTHVEVYHRNADRWILREWTEGTVRLDALDVDLEMEAVYDRVDVPATLPWPDPETRD